ncbi:MAG: tetratricopeptide repeat protein [Woeseiaceae bacterium]|nr:tetratricopeptide repeat protein [Woeseiaceae bacterium]
MQALNQALAAGYAAMQRGDLAAARQILSRERHPKAVHLLALVEKAAGNVSAAASLFEKAASLDPNDPEIANNQGVLAMQTGHMAVAETAFRRALGLNPAFIQAGTALGRLLIDEERWDEAATVYDDLIEREPENFVIRFGHATVLLGTGQADAAEAVFNALLAENSDLAEARFMRGRARLEQGRVEEALADLEDANVASPSELSLKTLAGALWMTGDRAGFESLLAQAAKQPELVVTAAELLRQSGDPQAAVGALDALRRDHHLAPESWIVAATAYVDANEPVLAEQAARACLNEAPDNRIVKGSLITALLMQGRAEDALDVTLPMREAEPNGQHWIAYEATALRLLGRAEYDSLVDLDRFVRAYTLPVPEGFESLEAFNAAFLEALDRWHPYKVHPLDQSLRDGSQTPRDLTTIDDPVFHAFVAALDEPIRQYMADVGDGDDHPLTARNTGSYRIAGSWSVRLKGGGWHVNHVHPEGWISSAYYVTVPEETRTGDDKAGWIKFGEPPFSTVPPSPPQKWVRPEAGVLVLFPSFLWHGTVPIRDESLRVTAPFDAVPA